MKRKFLYVLLSVTVVGVCYCLLMNSNWCFWYFNNTVTETIKNRSHVWFKYSKIDSLYNQRRYKYFWFVWQGNEIMADIDTTLLKRSEVLMILGDKDSLNNLTKEMDMIRLPESAFIYLLNKEQDMSLCFVDSVIAGDINQYRILKDKKVY